MNELTKAFMWVAGGLASCVVAHALMIPLGLEQWLHTALGGIALDTSTAQGADDIMSNNL